MIRGQRWKSTARNWQARYWWGVGWVLLVVTRIWTAPEAVFDDRLIASTEPFRVLCVTDRNKMEWGSYRIRCRHMKAVAQALYPNRVLVDAVPSGEATGHYQAVVLIKVPKIPREPEGVSFDSVFVDVIDNLELNDGNIDANYSLLVQNQFQADYFPEHKTHIVPHWYNGDPPESLPSIRDLGDTPLRTASVWSVSSNRREKARSRVFSVPPGVDYVNLDRPFDLSLWASELFPNRTSPVTYTDVFHLYDVLIVYAKRDRTKHKFNSVQRTVSQMISGVPVALDCSVLAHKALCDHYPCTFLDEASLHAELERLKTVDRRKECQAKGVELAQHYSPQNIVRDYLRILGFVE